jgi:hypothetical protein
MEKITSRKFNTCSQSIGYTTISSFNIRTGPQLFLLQRILPYLRHWLIFHSAFVFFFCFFFHIATFWANLEHSHYSLVRDFTFNTLAAAFNIWKPFSNSKPQIASWCGDRLKLTRSFLFRYNNQVSTRISEVTHVVNISTDLLSSLQPFKYSKKKSQSHWRCAPRNSQVLDSVRTY